MLQEAERQHYIACERSLQVSPRQSPSGLPASQPVAPKRPSGPQEPPPSPPPGSHAPPPPQRAALPPQPAAPYHPPAASPQSPRRHLRLSPAAAVQAPLLPPQRGPLRSAPHRSPRSPLGAHGPAPPQLLQRAPRLSPHAPSPPLQPPAPPPARHPLPLLGLALVPAPAQPPSLTQAWLAPSHGARRRAVQRGSAQRP